MLSIPYPPVPLIDQRLSSLSRSFIRMFSRKSPTSTAKPATADLLDKITEEKCLKDYEKAGLHMSFASTGLNASGAEEAAVVEDVNEAAPVEVEAAAVSLAVAVVEEVKEAVIKDIEGLLGRCNVRCAAPVSVEVKSMSL